MIIKLILAVLFIAIPILAIQASQAGKDGKRAQSVLLAAILGIAAMLAVYIIQP